MTLEKTLIWRVVLLGAFTLGASAFSARLTAAPTPSPALLITVRGPKLLAIADPRTMTVVATVPIGEALQDVAVSDDGKLAFVTGNHGGIPNSVGIAGKDYISVIDLAAQKEVRRIETGINSYPHGIHFADGKVYFSLMGYQAVGRYDMSSNEIEWMMGTGQGGTSVLHSVVMTKDMSKIFTEGFVPYLADPNSKGADANCIFAIETGGLPADYRGAHNGPPPLWRVTVIPVGKGPEGTAISPDEKQVWALNRNVSSDGSSIPSASIIDVATMKVIQTLKLPTQDSLRLAFTPDGKRVLIADGEDKVLVFDAVTLQEIKLINVARNQTDAELKAPQNTGKVDKAYNPLTHTKGDNSLSRMHGILISPDGSYAYAAVTGSDYIAVIDLKTLELKGTISVGAGPNDLAWAERQ